VIALCWAFAGTQKNPIAAIVASVAARMTTGSIWCLLLTEFGPG
jgi:hypothetical protein